MSYKVLLHPRANRFIEKAQEEIARRIRKKLKMLAHDPTSGEQLKFSDFLKVRIGGYRAIYEVNHESKRVIILFIGHRKDVYDDFSRVL